MLVYNDVISQVLGVLPLDNVYLNYIWNQKSVAI